MLGFVLLLSETLSHCLLKNLRTNNTSSPFIGRFKPEQQCKCET
jgi:hypothetical protein